ncbi:MAG: peptidylprolyl isomerase [Planctomycetota bacterium]|jgi:hypothetical protein|nr:peptidylprolyl isomerase [Planctomycetota bacterium]MDP6941092.1 peptidylprolyl isomerase [Planctomycetota bacterium]
MFALLPLLLSFPLQSASEPSAKLPEGIVAQWDGGSISALRLERFLGHTFHRKPVGQEALRHLLQIQLVEREASARGLAIPESAVSERIHLAEQQSESAGIDLYAAIAQRGMSREHFQKLIRDSLLHEELVRQDLSLTTTPTVEQQKEWTESKVGELIAASLKSPPGWALSEGNWEISLEELGASIHSALSSNRIQEYLEQLIIQDKLEAWAKETGTILTPEILQAEIEWRRNRVSQNPAFGGMTYEKLLSSQGSSLEAVKHGAELRAVGFLRLLARERWNDAWFDSLSPEVRAAHNAKFGESRQVSWLFLHAKNEKSDPLDLDFNDARNELLAYRKEMEGPHNFGKLASKLSEHEPTRTRDGMLGWLHRNEPGVIDEAVCKVAFDSDINNISDPFRTKEGMAILLVHQIRPRPDEVVFRELVRRSKHEELRESLLSDVTY